MTTTSAVDADDVLDRAEANVVALRRAEFHRLQIARDWAVSNPPAPGQEARNPLCARSLGASNVMVLQHVEAELAAALEVTPADRAPTDGRRRRPRPRLPHIWAACAEGRRPGVARKIAARPRAEAEQARLGGGAGRRRGRRPPAGRLLALAEARVSRGRPGPGRPLSSPGSEARGVWQGRDGDTGTPGTMFARATQ